MKKKKMEKKSIIITIILLLILGILIFMLFREIDKGFDMMEENDIEQEDNIISNDENLNGVPHLPANNIINAQDYSDIIKEERIPIEPINQEEIIGKWIAVEENARGESRTNLENYSIEFKNDKTYISIVVGYIEKGTYDINVNNITFYDKENNLPTPAFGSLDGNTLIITYPQYPKIVAYKREN